MSDDKQCTVCKARKPRSAFSPCRNGVQSACRQCRNAQCAALNLQPSVASRLCGDCGVTKPADAFWKNRRHKTGLQKACKECQGRRKSLCNYAVTLEHKECRLCAQTLPASAFCRDRKRLGGLRSECRACNSVMVRAAKYGLSFDEAKRMCLAEACEICGAALVALSDRQIDHCHVTGVVRGTLCWDCNKMLGCAKDSAVVLRRAASYLLSSGLVAEVQRG